MTQTKRIAVRKEKEQLKVYELPVGTGIQVGRSPHSHIVLNAPEESRHYATVIFNENNIDVQDHSSNGVYANGEPITANQSLSSDTSLQIGPFTLLLSSDCAASPDTRTDFKEQVLQELIANIDLDAVQRQSKDLRLRVEAAVERIALSIGVPSSSAMDELIQEMADEALGLGPLEPLLQDDTVSEIMVVNPETIYVESGGHITKPPHRFISEKAVRTVIDRIIFPIGRRVDELSPMVDARLADGSRVNVVVPPLAINGSSITIRKFTQKPLTIEDLIRFDSLSAEMAAFLERAVQLRANIVISGGTGSGKTTLLSVLSSAIPERERIVTIEDAAELRLSQDHVVALESRPPGPEGKGAVTISRPCPKCPENETG